MSNSRTLTVHSTRKPDGVLVVPITSAAPSHRPTPDVMRARYKGSQTWHDLRDVDGRGKEWPSR